METILSIFPILKYCLFARNGKKLLCVFATSRSANIVHNFKSETRFGKLSNGKKFYRHSNHCFINKVECSKASENFLDTNVEDFMGAFCPFSRPQQSAANIFISSLLPLLAIQFISLYFFRSISLFVCPLMCTLDCLYSCLPPYSCFHVSLPSLAGAYHPVITRIPPT